MDYEVESAKTFFGYQKIKVDHIRKTQKGSFDIFEIYPSCDTKILKIEKSVHDFGVHMGCLTPPVGSLDYIGKCYKINLHRRKIESAALSDLLRHHTPVALTSPCPLGWTALGEPLVVDLAGIPNLLVAGSPGSGKSTLIKAMIEGLLHSGVAINIIDPKIVDFANFKKRDGCSVESNPDNFSNYLDDIIFRMNHIYDILGRRGFSSIQQNNATSNSKITPLVVFIDEWSDVNSVNKNIAKKMLTICQRGRAAGISVVLATQRPSSSILPGEIKANFTGRIALRVSSEMESRIIIDSPLASSISERGLGYYKDQNNNSPILFRVAHNDIVNEVKLRHSDKVIPNQPQSFWSGVLSLFSA